MRNKKSKIIILILLFIFGLLFFIRLFSPEDTWLCQNGEWTKHGNSILGRPTERCFVDVQIASSTIHMEVSSSNSERQLGLSGRKNLPEGTGMLFIFDKDGSYEFWMKDMNFPIDIIWVDSDFTITGIEENLKSETYPKVFGEKYLSKYVLEVPSGFSFKNNIKVGNKIIFLEE